MVQALDIAEDLDVLYAYEPSVYDKEWGPNQRPQVIMLEDAEKGRLTDIGLLRVKMVRWKVDIANQQPPLTPDEKRRAIAALDKKPRFSRVTAADIPAHLSMADVQAKDSEIARLREENEVLRQIRELTGEDAEVGGVAYEGSDTDPDYAPSDPAIEWEQAPPTPIVGTPYPAPLPEERPAQTMRVGKSGRMLKLEPCPVEGCERSLPGRFLHKGGMRAHSRLIVQHDSIPEQTEAHQRWLDAAGG